ncbi:MAG: VWA domain-containing protein [Oscillospiraceae bacterium]|jgi:Ca-activated chloride channel family protein|nr:VWA domain-containing protein [Oscillospiraceae bacterium]
MNKRAKMILALPAAAAVTFSVVFGIVSLTKKLDLAGCTTEEKALQSLNKLYKRIKVDTPTPLAENPKVIEISQAEVLPDIDQKYPPAVEKNTGLFVEIFSSPEKADTGTDGWLRAAVPAFNTSGSELNGKPVGVRQRSISSGVGAEDYIAADKYTPGAFTPSNELWGETLSEKGVKTTLSEKRMAGNIAAVPVTLESQESQKKLVEKYGSMNLNNIAKAVRNGELSVGYANPFASSAGLNDLLSTLLMFDPNNPLSKTAVQAFADFSFNIPFVAYNTLPMRDAAVRGSLDGFVLEYRSYANMPDLQKQYSFMPLGVRHHSPLCAIGKISGEKMQILKLFNEFCKDKKWQSLATDYGFNQLNDYQFELNLLQGNVITKAQKLWKEKKYGGQPISAVFFADVSASMDEIPLNGLKQSLINGLNYIGQENAVGFVTFSNEVSIALPIERLDATQCSLMAGTVENLQSGGGTKMYDVIVVGLKMLTDEKKKNPDTKLTMFVLTDGKSKGEPDFDGIKDIIAELKLPVFTIGRHSKFDVLQQISSINDAVYINVDKDDVVYQFGNLF